MRDGFAVNCCAQAGAQPRPMRTLRPAQFVAKDDVFGGPVDDELRALRRPVQPLGLKADVVRLLWPAQLPLLHLQQQLSSSALLQRLEG